LPEKEIGAVKVILKKAATAVAINHRKAMQVLAYFFVRVQKIFSSFLYSLDFLVTF